MKSLSEIKLARLSARSNSGISAGTTPEAASPLSEAKQEARPAHRVPKFVQHCVTAIVSDPAKMAKISAKRPISSPFAICTAEYQKNKGKLAAAHAQGQHHTAKEFELALAKLRESVDDCSAYNVPPSLVVFTPNRPAANDSVTSVRFSPLG